MATAQPMAATPHTPSNVSTMPSSWDVSSLNNDVQVGRTKIVQQPAFPADQSPHIAHRQISRARQLRHSPSSRDSTSGSHFPPQIPMRAVSIPHPMITMPRVGMGVTHEDSQPPHRSFGTSQSPLMDVSAAASYSDSTPVAVPIRGPLFVSNHGSRQVATTSPTQPRKAIRSSLPALSSLPSSSNLLNPSLTLSFGHRQPGLKSPATEVEANQDSTTRPKQTLLLQSSRCEPHTRYRGHLSTNSLDAINLKAGGGLAGQRPFTHRPAASRYSTNVIAGHSTARPSFFGDAPRLNESGISPQSPHALYSPFLHRKLTQRNQQPSSPSTKSVLSSDVESTLTPLSPSSIAKLPVSSHFRHLGTMSNSQLNSYHLNQRGCPRSARQHTSSRPAEPQRGHATHRAYVQESHSHNSPSWSPSRSPIGGRPNPSVSKPEGDGRRRYSTGKQESSKIVSTPQSSSTKHGAGETPHSPHSKHPSTHSPPPNGPSPSPQSRRHRTALIVPVYSPAFAQPGGVAGTGNSRNSAGELNCYGFQHQSVAVIKEVSHMIPGGGLMSSASHPTPPPSHKTHEPSSYRASPSQPQRGDSPIGWEGLSQAPRERDCEVGLNSHQKASHVNDESAEPQSPPVISRPRKVVPLHRHLPSQPRSKDARSARVHNTIAYPTHHIANRGGLTSRESFSKAPPSPHPPQVGPETHQPHTQRTLGITVTSEGDEVRTRQGAIMCREGLAFTRPVNESITEKVSQRTQQECSSHSPHSVVGEIQDDPSKPCIVAGGKTYQLAHPLGDGTFGEVHKAVALDTGVEVAIKLERVGKGRSKRTALANESETLTLAQDTGCPKVLWFGRNVTVTIDAIQYRHRHDPSRQSDNKLNKTNPTTRDYNMLVMELKGANLQSLFELGGMKWNVKTVCLVALRMIEALQSLHARGLLHRDIKPENMCVDRNDPSSICLIDFSVAQVWKYQHSTSAARRPARLIGTPRYASINAHCAEQGPGDDMESLGYNLLYFVIGKLPWQGFRAKSEEDKYAKIYKAKKSTSLDELCKNVPGVFKTYLKYCRDLPVNVLPNYAYCRQLFRNLLAEMGEEVRGDRYPLGSNRLLLSCSERFWV
eukprot:GHVN01089703.1.p1 GENE.GHVN01089703.1~~GHVN01089703.1.p1  ORF type:complete len:1101 (-),score=216.94 GHVN01089703.1:595-3897(-)